MASETFFTSARPVGTIYCDKEGDNLADVRFCLCRFGEAIELCLDTFWQEQPSGNFTVCPIFSHGLPPRLALSTAQSVSAALQVVDLEPGSALEKQWREVANHLGVAWPKRFSEAA